MTKPALPPATTSIEVVEIEIDALDGMEWEQGQRTPQASDANLAALVKKSANQPEPAVPHVPRRTPLKARARVTGSEPPQPVRPPDPPLPTGPRAARPVSSGEHGARVTQLGPPVAPVPVPHIPRLVAPDLDRPISPPPLIVERAGSPPLEHTGTDFDVSTRNNTLQRGATPAVPSGPPRTLNDILRAPARVVSAESVARVAESGEAAGIVLASTRLPLKPLG